MHVLVRLVTINLALWGHLLRWGLVRAGFWRSRLSPAQCFVLTREGLGTTVVKLGQGLSLHRELLPDDRVAALHKLHDRVAPFPAEQAAAEIEASCGRPVSQLFAGFGVRAQWLTRAAPRGLPEPPRARFVERVPT